MTLQPEEVRQTEIIIFHCQGQTPGGSKHPKPHTKFIFVNSWLCQTEKKWQRPLQTWANKPQKKLHHINISPYDSGKQLNKVKNLVTNNKCATKILKQALERPLKFLPKVPWNSSRNCALMWDLCDALWWQIMLSLPHSLYQSSQQRHVIPSSDGAELIKRQQIKVLSSKEEENDKIGQAVSQTKTVSQPIIRPYHLPMPHAWRKKTLPQWVEMNAQPLEDKTDQMLFTKWHAERKLIWSVGMSSDSLSTPFETLYRVYTS